MADKKPDPKEMYQGVLAQATDNVKGILTKHDDAGFAATAAIAKDVKKVDKKNDFEIYKMLAKASVAYKKEVGIPAGAPDSEHEIGEVIRKLKQSGISAGEVVKRFQIGQGRKVVNDLFDDHQSAHVQGKHATWYSKNIGSDYDKKSNLAKGYKSLHRSADTVGNISENLEQKILSKAYQGAQD